MGCGDACPVFPGKRYLDWELDDPAGKSVDEVRVIRDQIDERVKSLVGELLTAFRLSSVVASGAVWASGSIRARRLSYLRGPVSIDET